MSTCDICKQPASSWSSLGGLRACKDCLDSKDVRKRVECLKNGDGSLDDKQRLDKLFDHLEIFVLAHPFKPDVRVLPFISHPLFDTIMVPNIKDLTKSVILTQENFSFEAKKRFDLLRKSCTSFEQMLFYLRKPYWVGIIEWMSSMLNIKEYNQLLHDAWTQVEFPHQLGMTRCIELFEYTRPQLLMYEKEEYDAYKELPNLITVYRGLQRNSRVRALSWTTELPIAMWFAKRFDNHGEVWQAQIRKKDVYMFTNNRNEYEVVLNPRRLHKLKLLDIPREEEHERTTTK